MADLPSDGNEINKFWDRPPRKDKGDDRHEGIHQAMGYALTQWEAIEYHFLNLFCHFVEPRQALAAARGFGSISSSDGRQEALTSAAEVYFIVHKVSEDLQKEFGTILKHFPKARGRRNEIAHSITMNFQFAGGEDAAGVFLLPAMYGTRKTYAFVPDDGDRLSILRSHYRYTAADIRYFSDKFGALEHAILTFQNRFAAAHPRYEPK